MKKLSVFIRAELEVPDDWDLEDHPSGVQVLKIEDKFVDFDIAPLVTKSLDADAEWSDSDADLVEDVLEAVVGLDCELELTSQH